MSQDAINSVKTPPRANAAPKTGTPEMTHSALAKLLGVSRQIITFHIKKADAPELSDVEGWREYLEDKNANISPKIADQIALETLRIKRAKAENDERENEIRRGESVKHAEVCRVAQEVMSVIFGEHTRLRQTLPALLKGRTEVEIFTEYDRELKKIETALHQRLKEFVK